MSYNFGDSFDLYASVGDMVNGYWDSASVNPFTFVAGRFSGSRALSMSGGAINAVKSSGVNDAVHHFVVSYQQTQALSGTTLAAYLILFDGATAQCTIFFRSDGAILLYNGGLTGNIPAGTLLDTYTGAIAAANTWYGLEFEVVINAATGSWAVRKNGNTVNDHALGSLNTKLSANAYANKLQIGQATNVSAQLFDDLYWQSGAATGTWLGDIRCYTRMPANDVQAQFTRSSATFGLPPWLAGNTTNAANLSANAPRYSAFISQGGNLASVTLTQTAGYTGNLKCAIFACAAAQGASGSIGAILGTATAAIANPILGANTFTFSPAISIPAGTPFYVGLCSDTTATVTLAPSSGPTSAAAVNSATAYASFPVASATVSGTGQPNYNVSPFFTPLGNYLFVSEPQQDALASYVYDANPGDADWYGLAGTAGTPAYVVATTIRGYATKLDAGTRIAEIQLKSGTTTVATPPSVLTPSNFQWAYRTDVVDPNTGAAWAASSVNVALIGPVVTA